MDVVSELILIYSFVVCVVSIGIRNALLGFLSSTYCALSAFRWSNDQSQVNFGHLLSAHVRVINSYGMNYVPLVGFRIVRAA